MAKQRHPRGIDDGDGITDRELHDLASNIAPDDYFEVGSNLDIPYIKLIHIRRENQDRMIDSMLSVLHKWKVRQGRDINIKKELHRRLRAAGLEKDGNRLRKVPTWMCMGIVGLVVLSTVLLSLLFLYNHLQGTDIDHCSPDPCMGRGNCTDGVDNFTCDCVAGYAGNMCETDIDECNVNPSPCDSKNGMCMNSVGSYKCSCNPGYELSDNGIICNGYVVGNIVLNKFQHLLRDEYNRSLFKIQIKPWDPDDYVDLKNLFTVVSLNKKDKMNISSKPVRKIRLNGSINDVFQTEVGGQLPERIVLVGEAGRGKTTAVAKMAYDWVNRVDGSPLKDVPLLFVLKMRHLKNTTSLAEGVLRLLGKQYMNNQTQLKDYINSHEKDVVILMDGYDEYIGDLKTQDSISDVIDILLQDSCKYCRVLVTTRPVRETDFTDLGSTYAKMELEGFSKEHAMFFIDTFFITESIKGNELKQYLEDKPVMTEMITTPLFCTMMCYMWGKDRLHGSNTRTALFDNIMDFLFKHANSKNDTNRMTTTEESIKLDDLLIHVGGVAYYRMLDPNRTDLLHFTDRDFINETIKTISFKIGLLTKTVTFDENDVVSIEFFHKLAQEYAAGKYLSNQLNKNTAFLSNISNTIPMEVLQFASGTSDVACKIIVNDEIKRIKKNSSRCFTHALELMTEANKCGVNSKSIFSAVSSRYRRVDFLQLLSIFGSEKEEKEFSGMHPDNLPGPVFKELWRNFSSITELEEITLQSNMLSKDLEDLLPLPMVKSFVVTHYSPGDINTEMFSLFPNMEKFRGDFWSGIHSATFSKVWNKLSDSVNLSWLNLCIPSIAPSELITLTSIKRFETCIEFSSERVIGILPKLPNINVFVINPEFFGTEEELKVTFEGFSELWSSLSISPHLHQIELFLPPYNLSASRPFTTVKVNVFPWYPTKYPSSSSLLNVLAEIPNIHELIITADLFEGMDTDESHTFFRKFWRILYSYTNITVLSLILPRAVPGRLEDLTKITTFQAMVKLDPSVLSGILDRLTSVQDLIAISNDEIGPNLQFHDVFLSTLADSVMKKKASLKSITVSFYPSDRHRKTISRGTVRKFTNMLKSSPEVQYVDIDCVNKRECLFRESDLLEIVKAVRSITSLNHLRISCAVRPTSDLISYAFQNSNLTCPAEGTEYRESFIGLELYVQDIVTGRVDESCGEVWLISRL